MIKKLLFAAAMLCAYATAQVSVIPITQPHMTFVNSTGATCYGCSLYSYAAGSTTPQPTYTDSTGTSQNTNPIILGTDGGANIWLGTNSYKLVLIDTSGSTVWSVDNLSAPGIGPAGPVGPAGPQGSGGIGCGTGNCVVTNPTASQVITQTAGTSISVAGTLLPLTLMPTPQTTPTPVNIILDTDLDTDPGSAIQVGTMMHWVDSGNVNLLAVTTSSPTSCAAPVAHIITSYYGHPGIPVGAYQGGNTACAGFEQQTIDQFNPGDVRNNYPACVTTLRTVLAAAANASVTYVGEGSANCVYNLLISPADGISALTGAQLIKAKVLKYVQMAGDYPSAGAGGALCNAAFPPVGPEFNFCNFDPADWSSLFTTWTVQNGFPPIYLLGYTDGLVTNAAPPAAFPQSNPIQYLLTLSGFGTRPVWGPLSEYYAIFGTAGNAFTISASGKNTVNATTGANTWTSTTAANHFYLTAVQNPEFYTSLLDGNAGTGAAWFMPYNQPGMLLYYNEECSFAYGCIYGGELSPAAIGPYTMAFDPLTLNLSLNKSTGYNVLNFEQNVVSKMAIGVDDGTGKFMLGTLTGDSGIRLNSGQKLYITNAAGSPGIGFNGVGSISTFGNGPAGSSMSMDDLSGGRLISLGNTTTTPNSLLIESLSSNFSVTNVLASMNAAGFIQLGNTSNIGVDQAGNFTTTTVKAGGGVAITNSSLVPQVGTPNVGQAACIKAAGPPVVIGFCSTVVGSTGACTCN